MLPKDLKTLKLVSASAVFNAPDNVSSRSGVYLFLLKSGMQILGATSYFETDDSVPMSIQGHVHLYTGAASNIRNRLKQHLRRDMRSSSLRKTLLAVEHQQRAISRYGHNQRIDSEELLTEWLCQNAIIGIQFTSNPLERERELIDQYTSPFNITLRRRHAYSRVLMKWRSTAFPSWRPSPRR